MNIDNKIIYILDCRESMVNDIAIENSIIKTLDFSFTTYSHRICIKNCLIDNLLLHSSWFEKGFLLENCIIKNEVLYEMRGHNKYPITFSNNIFNEAVTFLDCHFDAKLKIDNNIFMQGTTLLCDSFLNTFNLGVEIEGNVGNLNVNCMAPCAE